MRISAKVFLLVFASMLATANAADRWVRKHYISLGAGVDFTQGDLDGKTKLESSGTDYDEKVFAPNLATYIIPDIEIGANLNMHTIFVDFMYSVPETNFGKGTSYVDETETTLWRIGLGYRYNFFWPEPFQVAVGLSYSFMYLTTSDNAYYEGDDGSGRSDATMMGNGFALEASLTYFLTRHVSMSMDGRFRTMFFSSVSTDENGKCDLDDVFVQFTEEVIVKVSYHF